MIDAAIEIRNAVRAVAEHRIEVSQPAAYTGTTTVTWVSVRTEPMHPVPGTRLATRATVTLTTTAADGYDAMDAARAVQEALGQSTGTSNCKFLSVIVTADPAVVGEHSPSTATMVTSTLSIILMRRN